MKIRLSMSRLYELIYGAIWEGDVPKMTFDTLR